MEQLESANKSAAEQNHDDHEQSQFIENNDDGLIRFPAAASNDHHQLLDTSRSKPHKLQAVDDSGEILDGQAAAAAAVHNEEDLYSMIYLKGIFNNVDSRSDIHEAQGQVPFGNSLAGSDSTIVSTLHRNFSTETTHMMNSIILGSSSTPLRSLAGINQGIPNIPMISSSTVLTRSGLINGISYFGNGYTNYESTIDITSASSYLAAQVPTISRQKRKMVWQEDSNAPNHKRWSNLNIIQGESSRSFGSSNDRFTLYDRRYEEIGLPLDPHLRIFNATKAHGTTGST